MHNTRRRRAGATAAVLAAAAATTFAASTGAANAASVPTPAPAAASAHISVPASAHRATATVRTSFHVGAPRGGHPLIAVGPHAEAAHPGLKNTEYTENWSGYAADSGTYNSVSADWTQPAANCSATGSDTTASAFWIGIDGFNSSTVEQTGSEADCNSGSPGYYAWFEAYPDPSYAYEATVEPGDQFESSVTASGDSFELYLYDVTQNWYGEQDVTVSGAAKSSAEVIAEAPSSGGILPLTDFGTVNFSNATANGTGFGSLSPVQIDMESSSGQLEATTSGLSGNNFSVGWDSE